MNIDLVGTLIKFELYIYILLKDYEGDSPATDFFGELSTRFEHDLTDLSVPQIDVNPKFYNNRVEEELRARVEEKLNEEKDAIIEGLMETFFSHYIVVFKKIKE
ncbi:hypothetical protein QD46_17885 [Paenibacillus polymyxa]|uniref:hypothetical protein n=1 Tax=Paenibacillus polymyxa TaxID=1406 RepID=UPI0005CE38B4|nr:hypothetical protein [Paenibacillus polymyxa]KJD38696.1 hypothetical protein QD46_17885 [Paenibacillus polymyxa]MBY7740154.1 hypothetical protein [Paenibacillus polymyxa]